jgi:hypothetical protein
VAFHTKRRRAAVFHQARQYKTPTLDVALGVRKVVVSADEIDHLSVAFENAQRLSDALCANWETRDQRLLEHGSLGVGGEPQPYTDLTLIVELNMPF